jgi:hypothetical protein
MPHRNDVARFATLRPDHNDQTTVEMPCADEPRLAVIEPVIDDRCGHACKHLAGSREIESAMS